MKFNWNKLNPLNWLRWNTMFPGRPGYIGPRSGAFGLLHHSELCEISWDVMERVDYVKRYKDPIEIPIRLHNMIYLGGCEAAVQDQLLVKQNVKDIKQLSKEYDDLQAKIDKDNGWDVRKFMSQEQREVRLKGMAQLFGEQRVEVGRLRASFFDKRKQLAPQVELYIKKYIPDTAWNGTELVFPKKAYPR